MSDLLPQVLDVVRSVRPIVLPHWGKVQAIKYKTERYESPVTQFDVAAEEHIKAGLRTIDGTPLVGEEGGGNRSAEKFWLLDPIDGTAAYIEGLPYCTTMLALIEQGEVRLSVIYDFVKDILYYAEKGKGAYENGQLLHVSERPLENATLGFESMLTTEAEQRTYTQLSEKCTLIKTMTAGHEFALVAKGEIEGRICFNPYGLDYDFAPGALLVSEAGGIVLNIGSKSYDYMNLNFLAVNEKVFNALTQGNEAIFPINQVK